MPANNFSVSDIITRIALTLPNKFNVEDGTNIYAIVNGLAEALKFNTELIDELYRQTNLVSSSGAFVDEYISGLTGLGRKTGETDSEYKNRYHNNTYVYNCTKGGIRQIVVDLTGSAPHAMYNGNRRGAFFDGSSYYDDTLLFSLYGDEAPEPFTAYIQFLQKPFLGEEGEDALLEELCKTISAVKAAGITVYLIYPVPTEESVSDNFPMCIPLFNPIGISGDEIDNMVYSCIGESYFWSSTEESL